MKTTNWIKKSIRRNLILKEGNKMEVSIKEKKRKDDITSVDARVKQQVLNVRVTGILNGRLDIKIYNEIRVTYECVIKIT